MMFGKDEPLSQKPIYFFTSDSIKYSRRENCIPPTCGKKKKSYLVSFASILLDYVTGLAVRRCRKSALEMYVCSFKMKSYGRGGDYSVDTRLFYYYSYGG